MMDTECNIKYVVIAGYFKPCIVGVNGMRESNLSDFLRTKKCSVKFEETQSGHRAGLVKRMSKFRGKRKW